MPPDERDFILAVERTHRLNPVVLETLIEREYGIHIPHNRIWKTLKGVNYVQNTPTKQSRRKWVRFERRHSNSLWQMDFALIGRGEWLLLIIDDASRLLVGYARTKKPTAELAWETFRGAGERYGFPRQLLTDNGTQFTKTSYGGEGYFDQKLRELERTTGIKVEHIKSRVKHPQTGGKIERAIGTIKSKLRARWPDGEKQFDSLEEIITWYNTDRPHMSLRLEVGETPMMAFIRKLRPGERRIYLRNHPEDKR